MRGSQTLTSTLKVMASALVASLVVALLPSPAEAHHVSSHRKTRRHVAYRARSAKGSPYRSGGSSRRGFDCSGYTNWVFDGHATNLPRTSGEQFNMAKRSAHRRVWKRRNLKKGDLVFFKTTSARVGHVGIYLGRGKFISSTSSSGVRVDSVYDRYYWGRRWVGATRTASTHS